MKYKVTSDYTKSIKPKLNLTKILIEYIQKDFRCFSKSSLSNNFLITSSNSRSKIRTNFISSFLYNYSESNPTSYSDSEKKYLDYSYKTFKKGFQYLFFLSLIFDILIN